MIWPAYMTATRWAIWPMTARSWVTNPTEMPPTTQAIDQARIWSWMVTSRAVVGWSHNNRGSPPIAIAIMTRWRSPPDSSCGRAWARLAGRGCRPRASGPALESGRGSTDPGLYDERFGDEITDAHRRVQCRHRFLEHHRQPIAVDGGRIEGHRWSPAAGAKRTVPATVLAARGNTPDRAFNVRLLPEPDSPTMPRHSPGATVNDTPSTG